MTNSIINIPLSSTPPVWESSPTPPLVQLSTRLGINSFSDYILNEDLRNLVEGKRIAYVGPSPHLDGQKTGELIDSYDIIVRINQAYPTLPDEWEDRGKRTDISMNCLNRIKRRALQNNLEFAQSLKQIVCPMVGLEETPIMDNFFITNNIKGYKVPDSYLFKCFHEIGTTANTGLMGIITLLNYDIKELFITGLNFYNMNTFGKIYNDKYHDEASKAGNFRSTPNKEPSKSDLRMDIHSIVPQIKYFYKILKHHPNTIQLDNYLQNVDFEEFLKSNT